MPLPATMRAIEAHSFSVDALRLAERPVPQPRRGEILVHVRAASLNYRDLAVLAQGYLPNLSLPNGQDDLIAAVLRGFPD